MGLPVGYTAVPGVSLVERLTAIGNGIDVATFMHQKTDPGLNARLNRGKFDVGLNPRLNPRPFAQTKRRFKPAFISQGKWTWV